MIFTLVLKMMSPFWRYSSVLLIGYLPFIGMFTYLQINLTWKSHKRTYAVRDAIWWRQVNTTSLTVLVVLINSQLRYLHHLFSPFLLIVTYFASLFQRTRIKMLNCLLSIWAGFAQVYLRRHESKGCRMVAYDLSCRLLAYGRFCQIIHISGTFN